MEPEESEDEIWLDYEGEYVLRICQDRFLARWLARYCAYGKLILVDEEAGEVWGWTLNEDASVTLLELGNASRWRRA